MGMLQQMWRSSAPPPSAPLFGQESVEDADAADDERVDKVLRQMDLTQQARLRHTQQSSASVRPAHAEHRANRVSQIQAERNRVAHEWAEAEETPPTTPLTPDADLSPSELAKPTKGRLQLGDWMVQDRQAHAGRT